MIVLFVVAAVLRMQEVVFIGTHFDKVAVSKVIDTCLVTQDEFDGMKKSKEDGASELFADPFSSWIPDSEAGHTH